MTRTQFWTLNIVGGICAALILASLILNPLNLRWNEALVQNQEELNRSQQRQVTLQNLATRIARAGRNEPALRELLSQHDLNVTLNEP